MMATMSAEIGFGFEVVDDDGGIVRMVHPDGVEVTHLPDAEGEDPTCIMAVSSSLMTPELFEGYVGAAIQSVPGYTLGDPTETGTGLVWDFASNLDTFTGIVWVTRLIQALDGALTLEKRPSMQ